MLCDCLAPCLSQILVQYGGQDRASGELPAGASAGAAAAGRLILLAAGKAAGSMIEVAERHYLDECGLPADRLAGIAVTRRGYAPPDALVRMIEAGHPVPDAAGLAGAAQRWRSPTCAGADDLVLVLMSGGASANWIAPAAGLSLAEKQALTRALLALRRRRSARSTPCASISRASKAAGSPSAPSRRASSRSRSPTCRATTPR